MKVHRPRYGRYMDEFEEGAHWWHPRSITIRESFAYQFATTFMEANPIYLSDGEAQRAGYERAPVHPLLILNVALALGVEQDSEQAVAHLSYHDVRFIRPVYPGATLRSASRVIDVRNRGAGRPGVVRLYTIGVDERDEPVVEYERAILIPSRPDTALPRWQSAGSGGNFPTASAKSEPLTPDSSWPGPPDIEVGDVILHPNGRTVTDEHLFWSYWVGNTHPLHSDRLYSSGRLGALSGEPVTYGGLVFAWLVGLASRDIAQTAIWDLGYDEGYHTAPVSSGDTLYTASRLQDRERTDEGTVLTYRMVGLRDISSSEAWDRHGPALFEPERDKDREDRIASKSFEVTRRLLYR